MTKYLLYIRSLLTLVLVMLLTQVGWGQTNLLNQNFGTGTSIPTGWTSTNTTNGWSATTGTSSSGYSGSSGSTNIVFNNTGTNGITHTLTYNNSFSTVGYSSITVLWGARATASFSQTVTFQWSSDGTNWNTVSYTSVASNATWALVNGGSRINLPAGASGVSNLRFRWSIVSNNNGTYRIDDFTVRGTFNSAQTGEWSNQSTWGGGVVPTSNDNVLIANSHVVTISSDVTRNSSAATTINSGGTLDLSNFTFNLSDNLTNDGTISGSGKVVMGGSSAQTISGNGTISNLDISNVAGVTISSGAGNMQSITGVLTPTSGTLTTNGNLTLKSSASGTARVAAGSSSGGYVSGNVTVERYFSSSKRAWRLVTAPLLGSSGNSIFDNWQSTAAGSNASTGTTGVLIWGPENIADINTHGLQNGPAYSMRGWNNATGQFSNVTNTKTTPLFSTGNLWQSFFLFVSGPYSSSNIASGFNAVRVSATGALRQGSQTFTVPSPVASQYYMVGNPYASPVNHGNTSGDPLNPTYVVTMGNTTGQMWFWDPNLGGPTSVGGYVSFDRENNTYSASASYTSDISNYTRLQSGQAFFVRASSSPSGNLTVAFTESSKGTGADEGVFRMEGANTPEKIRVTLQRNFSGEYATTDGAVAFFYEGGDKAVNDVDGVKLMSPANNLMFRRNGVSLTFEHHPLVESTDTLFLNLRSTSTGAYRLLIEGSDFENSRDLTPILQDTYLNREQPLSLNAAVPYEFQVDGNTATSSGDRFRIVFTSKSVTPPQEVDPRQSFDVYPNPLSAGGQLSVKFNNRPAGNYTVVLNSLQGARVQQQVVQHAGGTAVQNIKLSSKLASGTYVVNILDATSRKVESLKVIIQ